MEALPQEAVGNAQRSELVRHQAQSQESDAIKLWLSNWRSRVGHVTAMLHDQYGSPRHGNMKDPTDELFYILLSNRTDPQRYINVFRDLRMRYRPWRRLMDATTGDLEQLLRPLGMERVRAHRILDIVHRLYEDFGSVSLNRLRNWQVEDSLNYLRSLPGVGEKTARCVLMYSFGHDITPVDVHQLRVLVRLGLLPEGTTPKRAHELLDNWLPSGIARCLHVNLLAHGRAVCTARGPRCDDCILRSSCPTSGCRPRPTFIEKV
jgi:endonuclease III